MFHCNRFCFFVLWYFSTAALKASRGERIRTSDLFVPNEARYQAALHPDVFFPRSGTKKGRGITAGKFPLCPKALRLQVLFGGEDSAGQPIHRTAQGGGGLFQILG